MTRIDLEAAIRAVIYDNTSGEVSGKEVADGIMMAYDTSIANGGSGTTTPVVPLTGAEIKALYEAESDTNAFTNALKVKLSGLTGSHFKGSHIDIATLELVHPSPEAGSYAYVMIHHSEHMFIWDGAAWVDAGAAGGAHLTDTQIKTQYENNTDTECFTPTEQAKLGSIPSLPTGDGDYVLNVVGGVFTWGLNSGGALVYDAHILGSTLAGDITLSPFVKHGGMDEETRNRGVNFADGGIYLVYPMYQAGMSAAHIGDTSPMFLADDYANASPVGLFNGSGTSMGSAFTGKQMNAAIAAGSILQIQYDSSSSKLLIEIT